jgi:metal-sulfur cluster biosynthetic enzyme
MTESEVLDALRDVVDPELGINVVDLGLVYAIEVEKSRVRVIMTMTSRASPLSLYLCRGDGRGGDPLS